jgi:hypothetical protein
MIRRLPFLRGGTGGIRSLFGRNPTGRSTPGIRGQGPLRSRGRGLPGVGQLRDY